MRQNFPRMPIPQHCDNCASVNIAYIENKTIYGKNFGEWPWTYFCYDCRASVGCHPKTNVPLGRMADKETKSLRTKAHASFDILWKDKYMTRTQAYNWLALKLGIPFDDCHMSQLSKEQLRFAAEISRMHVEENKHILERRRDKRNAKQFERRERDWKATKRHIRSR